MNAIPPNDSVKLALSAARQSDPAVQARLKQLQERQAKAGSATAPPTPAAPVPASPASAASTAPAAPTTPAAVTPASSTIHPLGLAFLKPEHVAKLVNPYAKLKGYVSNEYKAEFNKMTSGEAKTDGSLKSAEELAAFTGIKDVALAGKVFKALNKDGKNGVSLKELAPMLADGDIAGNHDGKASAAELTESAQHIVKNGGGKLPTLYTTYNPVPPAPPEPLTSTVSPHPIYSSNVKNNQLPVTVDSSGLLYLPSGIKQAEYVRTDVGAYVLKDNYMYAPRGYYPSNGR